MKYQINYGNAVISLPRGAVLEKLNTAGETELKLLIRLSSDPALQDDFDKNVSLIAAELGCSVPQIEAALGFWRGAGVISRLQDTPQPKTERKVPRHGDAPVYTGEELSEIIEENGMTAIIDECQRICGKVFNATEVNRIVALNSYLGMEPEHILLLATYCASINKSALRYIEKTAYDMWDMGINTTEKLEQYIRHREEKNSLLGKIRRLFGWGERAMTASEKKHFDTWTDEYGYDCDIITEAYNITVEKTGKLSMAYLSKILSNWYNQGFKTLEDVHAGMESYRAKKDAAAKDDKGSFDIDEFFEAALNRSIDNIIKK